MIDVDIMYNTQGFVEGYWHDRGMLRLLDSRWVSRAGNLFFLLGAVLFVWKYVSRHDPLFLVGVVGLVSGVLLMATPPTSRWWRRREETTRPAATAVQKRPTTVRPPQPPAVVRTLARALAIQAQEQQRLGVLPLATELRDIRRKIEKIRSMPAPVYWQGFRLPGQRWHEYHKALATKPELYKAVERAYVAAGDVNEAIEHRRTIAGGRQIGPNPSDGLDAAYATAGEALDALGQPHGEPWRTATQKVADEIVEEELGTSEPEKTAYGRLRDCYLEGHLMLQEMEGGVVPNIGAMMYGPSRVATWTSRVDRVIQNVAPQLRSEWLEVATTGRTSKGLAERLRRLERIMDQVDEKDQD